MAADSGHRSSSYIRVFVSSTFSDLVREREALQAHVFPRLRAFCRQRGWRFEAIDLRWGVSREAGLDQRTMQICLHEIESCRAVSPRPNFIVLLGERYGWRPLPEELPDEAAVAVRPGVPTTGLVGPLRTVLGHAFVLRRPRPGCKGALTVAILP